MGENVNINWFIVGPAFLFVLGVIAALFAYTLKLEKKGGVICPKCGIFLIENPKYGWRHPGCDWAGPP